MKFILFVMFTVPIWTFAHDCKEVVYSAEDYAVLGDHDDDMTKTCLAAEKAALWRACVVCAGNMQSGDDCHAGLVKSSANEEAKVCQGFAEAKAQPCKAKLVHCADLTSL